MSSPTPVTAETSSKMLTLDYHCPTRIHFGVGRFAELGEHAASLGIKRAIVVSDPGIEKVGHTQRGVKSLTSQAIDSLVFDQFTENPTTDQIDAGVTVANEYKPDAIIAIGGGSSMDCAKGINFLYSCGGQMQDYWGVGKATADMLPMIAVPTTAGTGSEAQSFALISDAETHVKMACGDKRAAFRIAILDPELTLTQPARVTALTAIDAISHAVETYVTKKRNPISHAFSRQAWPLLAMGLEHLIEEPDDLNTRGSVQLGACLAGLAIENSMLGSAHALANPLTANYGIAHGEAIGMMLPQVVRHNAQHPAVAEAYTEMLEAIETTVRDPGMQLSERLSYLAARAGLGRCLEDFGVDPNQFPKMASEAKAQWTGNFNPVEIQEDDYLKLYQAAYQ